MKVTPISRFAGQDVTPTSYAYAAGNLVKETAPKPTVDGIEQVTEYRWDAEGRMVGMTNPYFQRWALHYDAEGQLVRQAEDTDPVPAKVTRYLADKNLPYAQILEERDGAGRSWRRTCSMARR